MSRQLRSNASNTGYTPEIDDHSDHEDTPVYQPSNSNQNHSLMPGFTAEQAASLQAFITASNKVMMDQMRVLMNETMDARLGPVQQQVTAPLNP